MKRLYEGEHEGFGDDAGKFDSEISRAVNPIIDKWFAAGYSLRDMNSVACSAITMSILAKICHDKYQSKTET